MELKELAKCLFFNTVTYEKYREDFLIELNKRTVIDKRSDGFYCSSCGKFSNFEQLPLRSDSVAFPKNNDNELWIVNAHYDGCCGWD